METQIQCPVTGEWCRNKVCGDEPACSSEADRILFLDPEAMDAAINEVAQRLGIDSELYAEYVYDLAFGAGASGNLGTELPSPF